MNSLLEKIIFLLVVFFSLLSVSSCSKTVKPVSPEATAREKKMFAEASANYAALKAYLEQEQNALEKYLNSLPVEQQISQLFLVNIVGNRNFSAVEKTGDIWTHFEKQQQSEETPLVPGGVIFFSYNIADTPEEIIAFTDSIKNYCRKNNIVPPYISVDQEGGLVNRLRNVTSYLPSCQKITENLTPEQAYVMYSLQAKQMKALGFDMNLAPVTEVLTESNIDFLGTRSFGSKQNVLDYGKKCITAYEHNGIATVLKHFPGNTNSDPHTGLPEITADEKTLNEYFVETFEVLAKSKPSAILMSHARTSAYDRNTPACLSNYWVTQKLLGSMEYKGLVISDDIFMAALEKNGFPPETACVMAIEAGVDVIMLSEKRFADVAAILLRKSLEDESFAEKIREAELKVLRFKKRAGIISLTGDASVSQPEDSTSADSRLNEFTAAKEQGVSFYNSHFTGAVK